MLFVMKANTDITSLLIPYLKQFALSNAFLNLIPLLFCAHKFQFYFNIVKQTYAIYAGIWNTLASLTYHTR